MVRGGEYQSWCVKNEQLTRAYRLVPHDEFRVRATSQNCRYAWMVHRIMHEPLDEL